MPKINQEEYEVLKALDDKWRWIARDSCDNHDGNLFVYPEKPFKNHYSGGWVCGIWIHPINTHLFQFIQWENDEPWNIQELIEGYEDESEEAEVKKDKEWAQKEVDRYLCYEGVEAARNALAFAKGVIKQLDEPEVLSQEDNINIVLDDLKEHIKEQQSLSQNVGMAHTPAGNDTHYRQYDYVLECINEYEPSDDLQNLLVPKQELPVIPQFVAEFLKGKEKYMLYELLDNDFIYDNHDELARWLYDNDEDTNKEREISLVLAQKYGYKVKVEQKYVVRLDDESYLQRYEIDNKNIVTPFRVVGHLKEAAIKFDNRKKAEMVAELVEGKAEEM